MHQFISPLIYALLVVALITLAPREWADAAVISAVVLLNAIVGFTQEHQAENAMQAPMRMIAAKATVLRDGRQENLDAQQFVPGGIVFLESGDVVPVDLRMLQCTHLEIDEALLTGVALPVVLVMELHKLTRRPGYRQDIRIGGSP